MNRDILESLVRCSAELQRAHAVARDSGREDIAQQLRKASWQIAAAIAELVPDQAAKVLS